MQAIYKDMQNDFSIYTKRNSHTPPHLHSYLECVYMLEGSLAIGQEQELYPMETGDFAVIFPETIHHYQVFSEKSSRAVYFMVSLEKLGSFAELFRQCLPENPVIPAAKLHADVRYALSALQNVHNAPYQGELFYGYLFVILARILPELTLRERPVPESDDLVYQTVSYISRHFKEDITLGTTALALGVSPYVLSRIFSSVFHINFNGYLNGIRLSYACSQLENTDFPITEIAMESGFSSLRTFNRVCRDHLRMSPRDYRRRLAEEVEAAEGSAR